MGLQVTAPAKVNLQLRVLGRRADGYHEIQTCLHALALHDQLGLELGGQGVTLELEQQVAIGMPVGSGEDNLVCRAASAFMRCTGVRQGVHFTLTKHIPAGAGLGGGSSDAAAALLLLNAACGAPLNHDALHQIAATLGADVPFFLRGGTQIGRGVGDRLEPVSAPPSLWFVLILPPFGTSTAAVYGQCRAATWDPAVRVEPLAAVDLDEPARYVNHLEPAAMEVEPRLRVLRNRVVDAGYPHVRMSGSGSTLFLAFRDRSTAEQAAAALAFLGDSGVTVLLTASDRAVRSGVSSQNRASRAKRTGEPGVGRARVCIASHRLLSRGGGCERHRDSHQADQRTAQQAEGLLQHHL